MSASFTPGPWFQSHREKPDGMWSTEVYDAAGETIASLAWYPVPHDGGVRTAREANAHLIASAPEMYAALTTVTEMLADQRDYVLGNAYPEEYAAVEKARAVLAKAEGRS